MTYRSGRQFDILNDNLIYGLHTATIASDFAVRCTGRAAKAYTEKPLSC